VAEVHVAEDAAGAGEGRAPAAADADVLGAVLGAQALAIEAVCYSAATASRSSQRPGTGAYS